MLTLSVRDGSAGDQILPAASIWASDDPITRSLERRGGGGVFWGPYLRGEEAGGAKIANPV